MCDPKSGKNEQKLVNIYVPRDCLKYFEEPKENEILGLVCSDQLNLCENCIVSIQNDEECDYFLLKYECCGQQNTPVESANEPSYLEKCYQNSLIKPRKQICNNRKKQNLVEFCTPQDPDNFLSPCSSNELRSILTSENTTYTPHGSCFKEQASCTTPSGNDYVCFAVPGKSECHYTKATYLKPSELNACQCKQYKTVSKPFEVVSFKDYENDPVKNVLFSMRQNVVEEEKDKLFCKLTSSDSKKCDESCCADNPCNKCDIPCNNFMPQKGFCTQPRLSCQCPQRKHSFRINHY